MISLSSALACEIKLPQSLLVIGEGLSNLATFQNKNCDDKIIQDLHATLATLEGKIPSSELVQFLKQKGHENITFVNNSIGIQQLKSLVRSNIHLPSGTKVKTTKAINSANLIALAPGDQVEVNCQACSFHNEQALNILILGFDGSKTPLTALAQFSRVIKAYRILNSVPSFSEITNFDILKEEYVESIPYTDLITDLGSLKFFKTNKPLKVGDLLRRSDLNAISLVKAGLKTEVIIESQVVRIKTHGISRSNGTIGELVEVFHPQKNKKYQGKVIDINKVLVEL